MALSPPAAHCRPCPSLHPFDPPAHHISHIHTPPAAQALFVFAVLNAVVMICYAITATVWPGLNEEVHITVSILVRGGVSAGQGGSELGWARWG